MSDLKTAGDLLNDAIEKYLPHATECNADECLTCQLAINRLRLAYKVWENSDHKLVALTVLMERDAQDLRLRKLEVLVGGANIEERVQGLIDDQKFAWIAQGKLLEDFERLQARYDAAVMR